MKSHTLSREFYTQQKEKDELKAKLIGYLISPFIFGWILIWYNYVWVQLPLGYWQWTAISIPFLLAPTWIQRPVFGILFTGAAIGQTLKWLGLIQLPFFTL